MWLITTNWPSKLGLFGEFYEHKRVKNSCNSDGQLQRESTICKVKALTACKPNFKLIVPHSIFLREFIYKCHGQ